MRVHHRLATIAVLITAFLALAAPAMAHVTVHADSTAAGSYAMVTFRVPHGCDGAATTAVRVQIPDGIESVTPQVNDGWDIEIGEDEVVWRGGPLPDEYLDEFGLSLQLPEDAAGETLYFPVVQECEGGETTWIEIPASPDADEPEHPAPGLAVTAAEDEVTQLDDAEPTSATPAQAATSPLSIAALVAGLLGLVLGGAALAAARRTT